MHTRVLVTFLLSLAILMILGVAVSPTLSRHPISSQSTSTGLAGTGAGDTTTTGGLTSTGY